MLSCWAGWKASAQARPQELSARLHLPMGSVEASLVRLEGQGQVLRGQFRNSRARGERLEARGSRNDLSRGAPGYADI